MLQIPKTKITNKIKKIGLNYLLFSPILLDHTSAHGCFISCELGFKFGSKYLHPIVRN
jgi:hypothetical protein